MGPEALGARRGRSFQRAKPRHRTAAGNLANRLVREISTLARSPAPNPEMILSSGPEPASETRGLQPAYAASVRYRLGDLELDTDRFALLRDGVERQLGPRVFRALVMLASHGDSVVTKEEMIRGVWDGDHVSDSAIHQLIRQLRELVGPGPDGEQRITTVYGRGYRMEGRLEPIDGVASAEAVDLYARPAIAVLPGWGSSGGESDWMVEGLADDLTARLASFRILPVIAQGTMHAWERRHGSITDLNRLGVRYGVYLSARRDAERILTRWELIDLMDGTQVASERYETRFAGLFEAQEEIAGVVAAKIWPRVRAAEMERALRGDPQKMRAWEAFVTGLSSLWQYSRPANQEARRRFENARRIERTFAAPIAFLGLSHLNDANAGWSSNGRRSIELALEASRAAVELDPRDPTSHGVMGGLSAVIGDREAALSHFGRALRDNPSFAWAHWGLGRSLTMWGRAPEAITHLETAVRLSPEDPLLAHFHEGLAFAHFAEGRPERAMTEARVSLSHRDDWPRTYHVLAAALAELGQLEEAGHARGRAEALGDRRKLEVLRRGFVAAKAEEAFVDRYVEALRLAGWE